MYSKTKSYYVNLQPQTELHYKLKDEKKFRCPFSMPLKKRRLFRWPTTNIQRKRKRMNGRFWLNENLTRKTCPTSFQKRFTQTKNTWKTVPTRCTEIFTKNPMFQKTKSVSSSPNPNPAKGQEIEFTNTHWLKFWKEVENAVSETVHRKRKQIECCWTSARLKGTLSKRKVFGAESCQPAKFYTAA
jgi:hypothetical protein